MKKILLTLCMFSITLHAAETSQEKDAHENYCKDKKLNKLIEQYIREYGTIISSNENISSEKKQLSQIFGKTPSEQIIDLGDGHYVLIGHNWDNSQKSSPAEDQNGKQPTRCDDYGIIIMLDSDPADPDYGIHFDLDPSYY